MFQDRVYNLRVLNGNLPVTMDALLRDWNHFLPMARETEKLVMKYPALQSTGFLPREILLIAPVPRPASFRVGYAFRNHHAVTGPGEIACMPDQFEKLGFGLEVAVVIGKRGRTIRAENADGYIAGLMIMNDFKDIATATGPWLITPDELHDFEVPCKENHTGKCWNLTMSASLNGEKISAGNLADMNWTFAELIERASYGADMYPGDLVGSGTVGTGCLLELNGTAKLYNADYPEQWLKPGDEIVLSVEGLGTLTNTITRDTDDFSLLEQKKTRPT
jgi:fumarylacetoacetate (FAA) hydrolase